MIRIDVVPIAVAGISAIFGVACTSANPSAPPSDSGAEAATSASTGDASAIVYGQCSWPASLDDAGPGACTVGRAYVTCSYPVGVVCEGGPGAFGPGGVGMACISDDPTSCSGCSSTSGVATCKDMCGPNEYAVSCGGPPHVSEDGASDFAYQEPPDACVFVAATPGGNEYECCPCQ